MIELKQQKTARYLTSALCPSMFVGFDSSMLKLYPSLAVIRLWPNVVSAKGGEQLIMHKQAHPIQECNNNAGGDGSD